mmetsp:Transcript_24468/g.56752  ORF Transcript_24468/g.56752 Transcript_24468/m.56752 type:complete len:287 (+) Transcript_24468:44-904(+)
MMESELDGISEVLEAWADTSGPQWQHVLQVELDSASYLSQDVYFIKEARIPALTVVGGDAVDGDQLPEGETRRVTVEMLSGETAELQLHSGCTVETVKQMMESRLQIPTFLQRIIAGSAELLDGDVLPGDRLTLLQKEPPMISTDAFLQTMVFCVHKWEHSDVFRRWHEFETYRKMPVSKDELMSWAMAHGNMKNLPLSTENVLACLDIWMDLNENAGQHPDAFRLHVEKATTFWQECCFNPSLFVVYEEPYAHDDVIEQVFFMAGRLRNEPQTLLVQSFLLNCWS